MKSLAEYMLESLSLRPMNWNQVIPMGRLEWKFKSKDYKIDENIKCDDWNAGFTKNNACLVFWSPKCTWMPYVYLSEVKAGKTNWALVSYDDKTIDVIAKVLTDFDEYRMESATVPELDSIVVPKDVEHMLKDLK